MGITTVGTKPRPAIIGGERLLRCDEQPNWPQSGPIENAILQEITDSDLWTGFRWKPAVWRSVFEQVAAATMGYGYGIGQSNGTLSIASGIRAQLVARGRSWSEGRSKVLVPDFTCTPAHHGVLMGVAAALRRFPELVPIDAEADGTMNVEATAAYLNDHADDVLAIVPVTMYGNYGRVERFVELAAKYDLAIHHDDAHGAAGRYDGQRAATASVSGHADAKTTPTCEGGLVVADDPEIAWLVRADTDCGTGPGHLDAIPYADLPKMPSGNQRLGEQPAALFLTQWLRALHARLQARENRRLLQELTAEGGSLGTQILWNPPMDAEYPPYYALYFECTDALEETLGLSPSDLRAAFTADGLCAERPFLPTHLDPLWSEWAQSGNAYDGSARIHERGFIIHTKHLRDPRLVDWFAEIMERIIQHKDSLRGVGALAPEPVC